MSRCATLATLALLLTAGYASAQNTMTSGRPSGVLNDSQCQEVWSKAAPNGDKLAQADAAPYIVNWHQVDPNNNGAITKAEFWAACGKGLVKYMNH